MKEANDGIDELLSKIIPSLPEEKITTEDSEQCISANKKFKEAWHYISMA